MLLLLFLSITEYFQKIFRRKQLDLIMILKYHLVLLYTEWIIMT